MSGTLPTTTAVKGQRTDEATLPQAKGTRLAQLLDVSREVPVQGDALVYDESIGLWVPKPVLVAGAITNELIADNSITAPKIMDGAVTDDEIGNRTITDTTLGNSTDKMTGLLGSIGNRIKAITGGSSWRDTPGITLAQLVAHKARHATGGADALSPADIGAATSTHTHADATTTTSGFMSGASVTKLNGIATNATNTPLSSSTPDALTVGQTGSAGSSTNAARADHQHAIPGVATGSTDGFMSALDKSKLDTVATGATTVGASTPQALSVGGTASVGTSLLAARQDHRHAMPGNATAANDGFMSQADKSKLDGIAAGATNGPSLSSTTPDSLTVGQTGSAGTGTTASRYDHAHALPGYATTSTGGFMSASDKSKLDSLNTGAYYSTKPTGDHVFPASTAAVDWMKITLPAGSQGIYLVTAVCDLDWQEADDAVVYTGALVYTSQSTSGSGVMPLTEQMIFMSTAVPVRLTLSQQWVLNHSSSSTRYLYFRPSKTAAGGSTSRLRMDHSSLVAIKIG